MKLLILLPLFSFQTRLSTTNFMTKKIFFLQILERRTFHKKHLILLMLNKFRVLDGAVFLCVSHFFRSLHSPFSFSTSWRFFPFFYFSSLQNAASTLSNVNCMTIKKVLLVHIATDSSYTSEKSTAEFSR